MYNIFQATKKVSVANVEGPMNAIADIRMRIEHGASVNEVISAYEAHEFPELEKVESQMAMIKAVERVGQSATVHEVLQEECMGKKEIDLQNVGFKALISTIKKESFKVDEVITQFQPDDFEEEVVQDRLGQLVTEAQQLDTAQVNPQTTQLANANEQLVTQVFHGPNQYRYKSLNWKQKIIIYKPYCTLHIICILQESEVVQEARKVSFKQEEIHISSTKSEMTSATASRQETKVQEQTEQQGK